MKNEKKWQAQNWKKPGRKPGKKIMYLDGKEFDQFFKALIKARARDYAMFWIGYRWGLRASEITKLRKAQVNLDTGKIFVYRVKGSESREYDLPKDCKDAIKAWRKEREKMEKKNPLSKANPFEFITRESGSSMPMSVIMVKKLFVRYARISGIPADKHFVHTLRHTRGYRLANADPPVDIKVVKEIMGHKNLNSTDVYYQLAGKRRQEIKDAGEII